MVSNKKNMVILASGMIKMPGKFDSKVLGKIPTEKRHKEILGSTCSCLIIA